MKTRRPLSAWLRLGLQAGFVLLAIWMGVRHRAKGHSFDETCPFGGVETAWRLAADGVYLRGTGPVDMILLAALLVAALLTGRGFCGWACPLGTAQEGLAWLASRLSWLPLSPPPRLDRALRMAKYLVLGLVLWGSATAILPPLIPFCPYRTLFTLNLGSTLGWSVLIAFALLSLAVDRFWCRYLCPLGAILALTNRISPWRIRVDEATCASCGLCARACPMDLDVPREVERGLECIRCRECVYVCRRPGAIEDRV